MKPKPWAILSGCGCGFLTLVGGGAILCLAAWYMFEYAGVRTIAGIKNNGQTMLPIAFSISAFLAVPLGLWGRIPCLSTEAEKGVASASGAANLDRMDNPLHHLNAAGLLFRGNS